MTNQTITANDTFAVVGATGKTGQRVLQGLKQLGYEARGLSRNSDYAFDWADQSGWKQALEGAKTAYVTYFPDLAVPQAESDVRDFVALAKSVGVKHIVLLSGRGEEGAQHAENVVINSGLDWNVVRASWFMQNFSESFMLDGLKAGELLLPEPKADEPFIDVNDIADVAVAALTQPSLRNQLFEVTGPELLSFAYCVKAIGTASNRNIAFQTTPVEAYIQRAKSQGLPDDIAWLLNELFENVLDGRNESTTNTVENVLGRPARRFEDYVARTAKTGVWSAAN
ncbi:NAD(P)H-binding protein [Marinomonas foliarum]|uniref:NmrA family transcriptional regulator n=1 Tax=Marinomonas foliarum TaxID=491950 RepID=A0ABX7IKS0_9GAMM|nr:NAD(P)H-binding protein [Marinomonas foliarum]QRV22780.1 NmrA family transcriptional regulator [Marinomonas foliarum]